MFKVVFFLQAMVLLLLFGCGGNENGDEHSKLLREHHLSSGEVPYADKEHIVLLSLEHPASEQENHDLHLAGSDCFVFQFGTYLESVEIAINDDVAVATVSIRNINSDQDATVVQKGSTLYYTFEKNRSYEYCAVHDGSSKRVQSLFIRIKKNVQSAQNQDVGGESDVTKLLTTNACVGCDLEYADLTDVNLTDANISGADMYRALLDRSIFNYADFSGADLTKASMAGTKVEHVSTLDKESFLPKTIDGASFAHSDLSGFSLSNLSSYVLNDINFSHSNLSGANLIDHNFSNCVFTGADLSRAYMEDSVFDGNNFTDANLSHAFLSYSSFKNAILDDINITGTPLDDIDLTGASLKDVNLSGASMARVQMPGMNLHKYDLHSTNLTDANLGGTNLSEANLSSAKLVGPHLNLSGAILVDADFSSADLSGVNLSGFNLEGVIFNGAILANANLDSVNLDETYFQDANLSGAKLTNTGSLNLDLSGADLTDANLTKLTCWFVGFEDALCINTDFTGANLTASMFSGADIHGAVFNDAIVGGSKDSIKNCKYAHVNQNTSWSGKTCSGYPSPWLDDSCNLQCH